ncbi:thiol-disulfide oxidoreductase DCC family protein [Marixanthomonas spongiae]|uniref:Thiol-disulfide oxidoreductase n=1 Tax=Marixanthomonas spongiae TaxID=2174845 RepID=A0A2U0I532_9FLAO|nr:DCC1-like thiol-disulfide oxidoreductase family protein [Marixanthomonas spongiae]PVW16209.1 thiol-disulfide oxidoreductase [Marixanthomonas spongiae]
MFRKFKKTKYPPSHKPVLVWDGECGFCKYWVIRWKSLTSGNIVYKTYQEVASQFQDIPIKEFKKASRLIETDGCVYSGPDSAYRSYTYTNKTWPWHNWYTRYNWFATLSDHGYNYIAKHRPFFFDLTKLCFGSDPKHLKPYWLLYLLAVFAAFYFLWTIL